MDINTPATTATERLTIENSRKVSSPSLPSLPQASEALAEWEQYHRGRSSIPREVLSDGPRDNGEHETSLQGTHVACEICRRLGLSEDRPDCPTRHTSPRRKLSVAQIFVYGSEDDGLQVIYTSSRSDLALVISSACDILRTNPRVDAPWDDRETFRSLAALEKLESAFNIICPDWSRRLYDLAKDLLLQCQLWYYEDPRLISLCPVAPYRSRYTLSMDATATIHVHPAIATT